MKETVLPRVNGTWHAVDNLHILIERPIGAAVKFNVGTDNEVGYSNSTGPATDKASNSSIIFDSDVSPFGPEDQEGLEFYERAQDADAVLDHRLMGRNGKNLFIRKCSFISNSQANLRSA